MRLGRIPLGSAEAGDFRDALDRLAGGLHARPRHLRWRSRSIAFGRRGAVSAMKGAVEMQQLMPSHCARSVNRQRASNFRRPGQKRPQSSVGRFNSNIEENCELAARAR